MVLYLKNFAFSLSASVFLQAKVVLCAMIMTVSRLKGSSVCWLIHGAPASETWGALPENLRANANRT